MIELATADHPWPQIKNIGDLIERISSKELPEIPGHLTPVCADFISQCLQYDKDKRPSARSLLPEGQIGGAEPDNYFSRASSEGNPTYWKPGDAMLNPVTDDAHTMAALKRAIAPNRPDEFGKGFDAGKEWEDAVRRQYRFARVPCVCNVLFLFSLLTT